MKHAFLAAALIIESSVAFAEPASVLLDGEKVRSMSAEEYAAAVKSATDVNARDENGGTASRARQLQRARTIRILDRGGPVFANDGFGS